ncbi:MAG: hypothetical protein ACOZCP_18720 [Pseudomonadota bacterium]
MKGTPQAYLAFAPRGAGLLCALFYFEEDRDVYGWFIGAADSGHRAAFFQLENFYSRQPTAFFATEGSDIQGGWRFDYARSEPGLDRPVPVRQDLVPELDRLQDAFCNEWLFFAGDPRADQDVEAYRQMELPCGDVAIKPQRLNKMQKGAALWRYFSHDFNRNVLDYLMPRWPLDMRSD